MFLALVSFLLDFLLLLLPFRFRVCGILISREPFFFCPLILLNRNSNAVSHCVAAKVILCNNYHLFSSFYCNKVERIRCNDVIPGISLTLLNVIVYLTVMTRQNFHLVLFKMSRFEQSVFLVLFCHALLCLLLNDLWLKIRGTCVIFCAQRRQSLQ